MVWKGKYAIYFMQELMASDLKREFHTVLCCVERQPQLQLILFWQVSSSLAFPILSTYGSLGRATFNVAHCICSLPSEEVDRGDETTSVVHRFIQIVELWIDLWEEEIVWVEDLESTSILSF